MPKKRLIIRRITCCLAAVCGSPAWALGFGATSPAAVLGDPLDFSVRIRLDAGEIFDAECVRSSVTVGDVIMPSAAVRTQVVTGADGRPVIQVRTLTRVMEPIVGEVGS